MDIDFSPPAKLQKINTLSNIPEEDLVNFALNDIEDQHYQPMPRYSQGKAF